MMEVTNVITIALNLAFAMLSLSLLLTLVRLVRGPSLPDRVVALELLTILSVGIIAAYDITTAEPVFLDAAIVLTLVAFIGAVAFARYVEKGASR